MNHQKFFDTIRPGLFAGHISQSQVDGCNAILQAWADRGISDLQYIAYSLATVYHECDKTMQPIRESGRGAGYDYGKKLKRGAGSGKRIPYTAPDQIYYGRGYVQLTWYENYLSMGRILKLDLLNSPDLALVPINAANIMIDGMLHGDFTGRTLSEFFKPNKAPDWIGARKIINGTDCAEKIAGYAQIFYSALA